jgi:F-type H+-transporting ATPase subunit epsilon
MPDTMHVEFVSAERRLWSGDATVVNARTIEGEIGIMAHHTPIMSVLEAGQIDVRTVEDGHWVAAVDGGFISVANNRVSILCERAEISHESDYEDARRKLDESRPESEKEDNDTDG